jgi:hypothetical protein
MSTVTKTTTPRDLLIAYFRTTAEQHATMIAEDNSRNMEWSQAYARMLTACANWLEQEGDLKQVPTTELTK